MLTHRRSIPGVLRTLDSIGSTHSSQRWVSSIVEVIQGRLRTFFRQWKIERDLQDSTLFLLAGIAVTDAAFRYYFRGMNPRTESDFDSPVRYLFWLLFVVNAFDCFGFILRKAVLTFRQATHCVVAVVRAYYEMKKALRNLAQIYNSPRPCRTSRKQCKQCHGQDG